MQIDRSVNKGALNKLVAAIIFVLLSQGIDFMYKN